ncbi:SMC family ATPase [Geomonas subterranea]|uniref:SMC family ATPase n=1 Tax=Geomonas subterranea TaxID=2847989 RepID=A0ABX8LK47_9BACT|nr:SMC family ATPase [Geomonas subterranea]QXE91849.1 SMC family ATPase [Geomonas subterranea]QXM10059.1 SMC family ATPase [Geomonas subterranea]
MRIVSVHLKNIKSHRDKELVFSPGINVLSGANGSGKSTIFEAIGYALFGVDAKDFVSNAERFLTIGTKRGEIAVVFEPAPGELYRVTRTVGTAGKWLLAKEIGGDFEVEEHANMEETGARIAQLLGLSAARPLSEQFKLVIGPFQNDFLGPFVIKQPAKRQDAFDEILGIDAWRKTQDKTKALTSTIKAKLDVLQAEVDSKSEQIAVLPAKEEELAVLRAQGETKQAELATKTTELEHATALLTTLESKKVAIQSVQQDVQGLEERVESGKNYVSTQQLLVEQSRQAAAVVAASTAGKQGYDAAEARLKALREQQQQKHQLEKKLADLEKEQGSVQAMLDAESRELELARSSMDEERKRLKRDQDALAAALAEQKRLEADAAQGLAAAEQSRLLFRKLPMHTMETTLPYLNVALSRIEDIDRQIRERESVLAGSEPLKTEAGQLAARQVRLEQIQTRRSELAGRRHSLVEGRDKIGAGACPFFQEPCQNLQGADPAGLFEARIASLDDEIAGLDREAADLASQVSAAQQAARELAGLEQVAVELAKAGGERSKQEEEFSANYARIATPALRAPLEEWLATAGVADVSVAQLPCVELDLSAAPQQRRDALAQATDAWQGIIAKLETTLEERVKQAAGPVQESARKLAELSARGEALAQKERELAGAQERAARREQSVARHNARLAALLTEVGARKTEIAAFADVERSVKDAEEELVRFQPARDSYIANLKSAEELGKHQETLEKYQRGLQTLASTLAARQAEMAKLVADYRPEQHEAAKHDRELLVMAATRLTSEIGAIAEGVLRLEGETAALRTVAAEIEQKLAAIEKLKEQAELVKFLRNQVFKNVSAQLSERFREEISFRADRIYRSICESDEELFWGDNYQIVLKDMVDGTIRERSDDQLSGGQMMSAVVALRLALLQTIGARIAFFDEPTSNLDAERRENLAKAFRAIDVGQEEVTEHWYDQLFLVSHDVSFTEITDQTIQLD